MAWTTPKTDWASGELVSASDMNAIGENLAALRHVVAASVTTEEIDLNAATFADIDSNNLNLTIATAGGDVLVHFHGSLFHESSKTCYFDIDVDGTRHGGENGVLQSFSYLLGSVRLRQCVSFTRLIQTLSAGSHTFKLQCKTKGQLKLDPGAQFWVREI